VMAQPQTSPDRPTAVPAARVATKAATAVAFRPVASPAASSSKTVAAVKTRVARPSQVRESKPKSAPRHKTPATPKAPPLDPEATAFPSATVWLNRAAPDTGVSPGGGVATSSDALSAVAQLALTIERPAQTGDLDPELAYRMSSLLLVIRDYIAPVEPAEHERIIRYLEEITAALR